DHGVSVAVASLGPGGFAFLRGRLRAAFGVGVIHGFISPIRNSRCISGLAGQKSSAWISESAPAPDGRHAAAKSASNRRLIAACRAGALIFCPVRSVI